MNKPKKEHVKSVKTFLSGRQIHDQWRAHFRNSENERFYELVFDRLAEILPKGKDAVILDAGCGSCAHTVRLARRGFSVCAVDFSDAALKMARKHLWDLDAGRRIKLCQEDLLSMSFEDGRFDSALCWGVLMHIPEVEKAIAELSRVVKKGGLIIISEGNMHSLQSLALGWLKKLAKKERCEISRRKSGMEHWSSGEKGQMLTRHADCAWLVSEFKRNGCALESRCAGQFTELYNRFESRPVRRLIHGFNNVWFRRIKAPGPAFGNLFVFRKEQ
ncbi:MAG: class I SAM-dependent methyltransferase [Thermodesulfobacteriota bacterium]|nr:MAG: class I SAM-dependent methyltransferase [Thermodesulfobacteriota bacterium]